MRFLGMTYKEYCRYRQLMDGSIPRSARDEDDDFWALDEKAELMMDVDYHQWKMWRDWYNELHNNKR